MTKPYKDIKSKNFFIREFSSDTPTFELVWHRDKKDRVVQAMHDTDWMFQMDNEIPKRLSENKLFIPKETYHRLLKGTGNLKVKIYEM